MQSKGADAPLKLAEPLVQEHMVPNSDVLPRHGFIQMAYNVRCQLYFPFPTEQVLLLRTGLLVHINAYMRSLGLTPPLDQPSSPAKHHYTPADSYVAAAAAAGPSLLKVQTARHGSPEDRDGRRMHANGVVSSADAVDVDSAGQWRTKVIQGVCMAAFDAGKQCQETSKTVFDQMLCT